MSKTNRQQTYRGEVVFICWMDENYPYSYLTISLSLLSGSSPGRGVAFHEALPQANRRAANYDTLTLKLLTVGLLGQVMTVCRN
jgi:hypothetical protein